MAASQIIVVLQIVSQIIEVLQIVSQIIVVLQIVSQIIVSQIIVVLQIVSLLLLLSLKYSPVNSGTQDEIASLVPFQGENWALDEITQMLKKKITLCCPRVFSNLPVVDQILGKW